MTRFCTLDYRHSGPCRFEDEITIEHEGPFVLCGQPEPDLDDEFDFWEHSEPDAELWSDRDMGGGD